MLHFLLRRPIAVLMSALGLIALGIVSLRILPISLLPEVPIPQISVQVSYANTSARELENAVTTLLRNQLLQVGRLRDIRSETRNGSATIVLEFDFGINTDLAFIEVNEKIDQAMDYLPRDLDRPRVIKTNVSDIPVLAMSVIPRALDSLNAAARSATLLELAEFSRVVLKRRIEQLPEVAFVDVSGYAEPEVRIRPDAAVMRSLGLTERDLEALLQQNNLSLGSIALQDNYYQYNVRFLSSLSTVEDIARIRFNHQGRVLQLSDVATVQLQPKLRQGLYLRDGQEAVIFRVYKQADAQLFGLRTNFSALLKALEKEYPQLAFAIANDQSEILDVSVNNLLTSLGYGALFAFLVLIVFFREWRTPLLIGVTVPVSLVIGFFGFYAAGISINVISLAGLILGIGLLVDNSIIVIENIRQQRRLGLSLPDACAAGSNEVIRPLISSALTTCSVFLPLIFLSGIAGALFYDQAISITVVLAVSLVAAYILIPVLVNQIERRRAVAEVQPALHPASNTLYYRTVHAAIKRPILTVLLFGGVIGGGYWLLRQTEQERFPALTREAIEVSIDWGEPLSIEENRARVRRIIAEFQNIIKSSDALIGEQQFLLAENIQSANEAKLTLYRAPKDAERLEVELQRCLAQHFPRAAMSVAPLKNVFDEIFGSRRPNLIVQVQSVARRQTPEPEDVAPLLAFLRQQGIRYEQPPLQSSYAVRILREPALRYDVPYEAIYARLQALFGQRSAGTLKSVNAYIPIVLGDLPPDSEQLLAMATVENRQRETLPLRYFVEMARQTDAKVLTAGKTGEALELSIPDGNLVVLEKIRQQVRTLPALSATFSGQLFENQRVVREVSIVALISLALLYFILAAQFESLLQPFIVLLTVPVGVTGAATALFWSGQTVNLVSLIGLVVMGGIAVNDAILKVDMMNRLSKNYPLEEAIHIASYRRLRAIVMTSLTTILALLPVLFSSGLGAELQRPLAFTVIGGLTLTTVASLYFVPALYVLFYRRRRQTDVLNDAV